MTSVASFGAGVSRALQGCMLHIRDGFDNNFAHARRGVFNRRGGAVVSVLRDLLRRVREGQAPAFAARSGK